MRMIDADALKSALWETWGYNSLVAEICEFVDKQPTVDAEPVRHGHWINHFDDLFPEDSTIECSECHEHTNYMPDNNYCPNCGAKMDGGINEKS